MKCVSEDFGDELEYLRELLLRSYVMQGAPFTQGTIPSISIGGSISPEACASRAVAMPLAISCWMAAKDTKKYRGSNSSDGGNTGDGVKIAGGVIGSGDGIELKEMLPDEAGK
ncbi:hypothetical protein Tco_0601458 [Tanacetum coccineum]